MKSNSRIMLLLLCLMFTFVNVLAQSTSVSGIVKDETGQSMPGVSITVPGTTKGVITDIDGRYHIQVAEGETLQFSFIGYQSQVVEVAGRTSIDIALEPESTELDDVVVVGYGTMKKSDLSGASVSVGEEAIKGSVITNLDQSLQGRAAGVTSVSTSGAPGSSSSIRVRGQATINANAEPLYVIDGVIIQGGGSSGFDFGLGDKLGNGSTSTISPLSTINPSDIVSMEILKDASATAIYGAQGANGVVLITTKHGKAGDAKFSYEGMAAWQRQTKRLDILDLREFAEYYNDLNISGEQQENTEYADPSILGKGTNWQDAIFRTAFQQQHQVSATGGSEKVHYYISGGFMKQDGTLIGSNFKRLSLRANLDAQLNQWMKIGLNAMFSNIKERLLKADQDEGIINYALTTPPNFPIYNVEGGYFNVAKEGYTVNPIAMALMNDILLARKKLNGNIFLDVTPIEKLTWHTELGFDFGWSEGTVYEPIIDLGSYHRENNNASIQKNENTYWQAKNYLTWTDSFTDDDHYTVMVGHEAWESKWNYISVNGKNLPSDAVHSPQLGTGTPSIGSGFGSSAMVSVFGRLTYNHADRYNLTYTYRRDASSNFGKDNQWAGFHAVAGAWRYTNEEFFKNIGIESILSNGKIRFGWGQTGNSGIGGYKWGSPIQKMETGLGVGYRPGQVPNTAIQWETQEQFNLGFDFGFLNNRVNLVVDLYKKTSEDMLTQLQLPSYVGTRGNGSSALAAPYGNYGTIENKGLEISLSGTAIDKGDFSWDSEFQISFNKNKLVEYDGPAIEGYGMWSDVVTRTEVGKSLYHFYGYKVEGVYKDLADIQNSPKPVKYPTDGKFNRSNTVWVGDLKFKDVNGDKEINEKDKTDLGSPMPKFTFGFNNTFRFKEFDLNIFLNGQYGNKVYNYLAMKLTHMNSAWANQISDVNDRARLEIIDPTRDYAEVHTLEDGSVVVGHYVGGNPADVVTNWYDDITNIRVANPNTKIPRATTADPNDNDAISDRYIEDGSYLRIKNITLGYNFKKAALQKLHLDKLRVYANIQNVATFTKYSGYDPEIGASTASANVYGLDNGRYPSPTVVSFGLNVTF